MHPWKNPAPTQEGRERLRKRWQRALDPAGLRSAIDEARERGTLDLPKPRSVRPVKLKQESRRFVVRAELVTVAGDSEAVVVKGYWDDRAGRIDANHRALWDAGLGRDDGIRTARPLGVIEDLGAAVTEWLPGSSPDRTDESAAKLKGAAAARLHSCGAELVPKVQLRWLIDDVRRVAAHLGDLEPELRVEASRIAELVRELEPAIDNGAAKPVHGDLTNAAFHISDGTTHLFDWDTSCRFDPAWDVGYHLAQLHRWQLTRGVDTSGSRRHFLRAYLEASGDLGMELRARFYEAVVYLQKGLVMRRDQGANWERALPAFIRFANERLTYISERG